LLSGRRRFRNLVFCYWACRENCLWCTFFSHLKWYKISFNINYFFWYIKLSPKSYIF